MIDRPEAYVQMLRAIPWGEQEQAVWDDYWANRMALERALGMRNAEGERVRNARHSVEFDDEVSAAQLSLFEVCA